MDAKELRAEAALTERSSDGGVKFTLQYDRSKCEAGAGAFKGETAGARPCAVIGPDRVVPPARDAAKKPAELWPAPDPGYQRLPDYPYKMPEHKDPSRNISPRQTFQENMQRIIMPPGYNATKLHEDPPFGSKNNKLNSPLEVKYCDVPYNINQVSSDQKHIRNANHSASNVNPLLMRGVPHGWPAGSVHVRPLRSYGAPEVLHYPDYANCAGPRPVLARTHTTAHDEQLYPDAYYHENNIRFKPYPNVKERYPPTRYEYLGNYPNPYHPPNPFAHKYELPKTIIPPHSYSGYPQVPKYTERIPDPIMDGYQRTFGQQGNYGVPIRNPVIHSPFRPVPANHMPNKLHPYPPDAQHKPVPNKLPFDPANKMYHDYDTHTKHMPITDNYYLNELPRSYHPKNTIVLPNFASPNMHGSNTHPCYPLKNYDYTRYKNIDPAMINHPLTKLPPQFSPSTLAISPADSNTSNETAQTHGTSQEDCGYASQSSVTSARSIESLNRMPLDVYGRYDYRYSQMVRASPSTKPGTCNQGSKTKKDIRQFISSWSEGDDENAENSAKRDCAKTILDEKHSFNKQYETVNNQEQLYVLGLVNVPSEELSKYEHIQKVSKLPENIKGYNSLELLNQFEEAIESSNITSVQPRTPRATQIPIKRMLHKHDPIPRALSPLDVEAKISQSVIHKDVGCNFEIKPCSPKMLNVEVATPMQTLLNERVIEKVSNPHNVKSPIILQSVDDNIKKTLITETMTCPIPNTASSCKMINSQHLSESSGIDHLKTNYSLQDLESNSGVCLASLPRLDNDIELNFPEVNQQFINANKTDSVITTSFAKDLPALDVDRSATASTDYDINYQFSPKTETETDFSRLSKYRKLKRCLPDDNDSGPAKAQATRVDSVIIKNPDNTRSTAESADNANPGSYFRNDFQEYAMNLVSQTKHSKENHHHDVDKMFGTSASSAVISRYDCISTHSPNSLAINQQSRHLDVIEETSRNNVVHAQSEYFSIHSKDLTNRCLEKAALDIPVNLSPQARYSTMGVDEEIRNSTTGDKTVTLDEKHDCAADNKNEEVEPKYSSALNLDKIEDTLIKSQAENLIDVSNNKCLDTREGPIKKPNIPGNCSNSIVKTRNVVGTGENDRLISHFDNHSHVNVMCSNEDRNAAFEIKQIDGLYIEKKDSGELNRGHSIFDDKEGQGESESTAVDTTDDSHKQLDTLKKYDRYVSKLKKKRMRTESTHRKRSFVKRSTNSDDVNNKTEPNLKILLKTDKEHPIKQSTHMEPHKKLNKDIPVNNIKTDNNLINKNIIDNVENAADQTNHTASKVGDMVIQFTALQTAHTDKNNKDNDTAKKIAQNCPDLIKDNNYLSCLPANDKCFEILSEKEINERTQNHLPIDFDRDDTKHSENFKLPIETKLILDEQLVTKNNHNNDASVRTVPVNYAEPVKVSSLQEIASIHFEAKELDSTSVDSDRLSTESNRIEANLQKNKDLDTQVLPAINNNQMRETKTDDILNVKQKKLDNMGISDQNEIISRESKPLESIIFKTKELGDDSKKKNNNTQTRENLGIIPSKDKHRYQNIPLFNIGANPSTAGSEYVMKTDISQRVTKILNCPKVCRPYVNKELFSSRFQNLLICNENIDILSDESKIGDRLLNLRRKILPTAETEMNIVKSLTKWSNEENIIDLDLSHSFEVNTTDKIADYRMNATTVDAECSKEKLDDKPGVETANAECSKENVDKTDVKTADAECGKEKLDDKTGVTNANTECSKEKLDDKTGVTNSYAECTEEKLDDKTDATAAEAECSKEMLNDKPDATTANAECSKENLDKTDVTTADAEFGKEKLDDKTGATAADAECSKEKLDYKTGVTTVDGECSKEKLDNKTDATTADAGCGKEKLDDKTEATTAEKSSCCNDSNVDNDFGEITENEDNNINENSSPDMQLISCDETQMITAADSFKESHCNYVTMSSSEKVFKGCDNDLENHSGKSESRLRLTSNAESDACATNVIVIDESVSMSTEQCHEFSKIDTPDVNNYEINKKIQSFVQNATARPRFSLKRSLSDSALNAYDDDVDECSEKSCFMLPKKRKNHTDIGKIEESHLLKIIQSSRRNSISTLNENFSFCILIDDHCIVAEENYEQDTLVQIEDDLLNHPLKDSAVEVEKLASPVYNLANQNEKGQDTYMTKYDEEKAWVEDVGCEETIETEDIAENIVIGDPDSPKDADLSDYESDDEAMDILNNEAVDHTSKVKHIYGDNMCTNDAQLVDALYRTPQMDVNKKLMDRESHTTEKSNKYYDSDSLEMLLAEPVDNIRRLTAESKTDYFNFPTTQGSTPKSLNKENEDSSCVEVFSPVISNLLMNVAIPNERNIDALKSKTDRIAHDNTQDGTIHSCESSLNDVFSYKDKEDSTQTTSSSPEVSSTTSEEKNSSILLKISNFKGSRISEVKSLTTDKQKENNCEIGEKEYLKPNYSNGMSSNRPLRTKAAQKYIPPLRESIPDLKVKLALPKQSLLKFQKNKVAKEEPKLSARNIYSSNNKNIKIKNEIPRKIKPKFEDVLKNIDEAQFQMHKEKNRKTKKYIPKVVIKKTENGSHYASTSTKESFNPDLTGRKWQPWVFIEKNKFIDDMALKNKTRAVFSHRRKSFVLAEKFCKYKSVNSAKFVISQPKMNDYSTGNLKYTIKLKHSY